MIFNTLLYKLLNEHLTAPVSMLYPLLPEQEIVCSDSNPFVKKFYESCFEITLKVTASLTGGKQSYQITLTTCPEDGNAYELLVSVLVTINGTKNWIDFDLWKGEQTAFELVLDAEKLILGFSLDVHDILAPRDLHTGGNFRNLRVLSSKNEYFVNATALNELGGSLFKDWYTRECTGETTIVTTEFDDDELNVLLKACCAYSSIVVARQTFDTLLRIAWKHKIVAVLRAIENYLLNARGVHVIDKLDLSYKYKFALLGSGVLKTLGNQFQRKEILLDYLRTKNIPFCPQHLLEILEVQSLY
ncbi:N terminal Xaa Pro Lys N methyltransferase 1 [Aphelenchoides bicaudatus]|nr:N terminal Xaa Pro Lys N methyltransferase 1 [Aphelenchoides bicaudatus]